MTAYLRIHDFCRAANQAFASNGKRIIASSGENTPIELRNNQSTLDQKRLNRQTWNEFTQNLIAVIGREKYEWICNRYRGHYKFSRLAVSTNPLLPEHIKAFSAGAAQILSRDIKSRFAPHTKLKELTRQQIGNAWATSQPFLTIGKPMDPMKISGSPSEFKANFFHDKILMDLEKQALFSDTDTLLMPSWLERFAKVTVNRELVEGQVIPAPGRDGQRDYYRVYRKIATGHGLVAYALKPSARDSTLEPLIVFRASQWALSNEDAIETYLNDVQPNVGELGWKHAAPLMDALMNDTHFRPNQRKVSIAGYSLGGAHAQRFLAVDHANVSHAVFYADPGVENSLAERAAQTINGSARRADSPLNIQIFRTNGDYCHYVGGKHIGWGITHPDVNIQLFEIDHHNKEISGFYLHAERIFDNTRFDYRMRRCEDPRELNRHLDNSKRGSDVLWYERMRRIWGGVTYYAFLGLSEMIKFFSKLFGVRVLRSSEDPQF